MRFIAFLLACSIAASVVGATVLDPVAPPPGLAPGSVYHRLFVTDGGYGISAASTYPPDGSEVGGLAGGDYQVTVAAFQAGWIPDWDGDQILFHAILSDGTTNAKDRLTISGPIYNVANEFIAKDAADLWDGSIAQAVRYDPFGNAVPEGTRVWTGSGALGTKDSSNTCGNWLNSNLTCRFGNATTFAGQWLNNGAMGGNNSARLYGLSDALTPSQPGDFNHDTKVDAADYVVWRKNNGSATDYDLWRAHYGETLPGSGSSIESASVPEPSSLALLLVLGVILLLV